MSVAGNLSVSGGSTLLCQAKNTGAEVNGQWAGIGVTITAGSVTASTILTVPTSAAPTMNANGQVANDTTNDTLVYYSGASSHTVSDIQTKCMVIDSPTSSDSYLFFRTTRDVRVTEIDCLVNAATSALMTFQDCDGNGGSCGNVAAQQTCGTTNTQTTTITAPIIAAGTWTRIVMGTVTGTVGHVNTCVTFKEDPK